MEPRPDGWAAPRSAGAKSPEAAMEPRPDGRGKKGRDHKEPDERHAAMEPRPDGRGKSVTVSGALKKYTSAAMEPRPDGRGKPLTLDMPSRATAPQWSPGLMAGGRLALLNQRHQSPAPQWSPGLMAGGSGATEPDLAAALTQMPQWSPGLMAGGRGSPRRVHRANGYVPQWSPGLMAGGRRKADTAMSARELAMPQWSPGLMAGGRLHRKRWVKPCPFMAAMEPRPDGRGKPYDRPAVPRRPGTAAMEPRPDGRGKSQCWCDPC